MNDASLSSVAFQASGTVTIVQPVVDVWRCQCSRSPAPCGSRRRSQGPSIRNRPEGPVWYSVRSLGVETTDWAAAGTAAVRAAPAVASSARRKLVRDMPERGNTARQPSVRRSARRG